MAVTRDSVAQAFKAIDEKFKTYSDNIDRIEAKLAAFKKESAMKREKEEATQKTPQQAAPPIPSRTSAFVPYAPSIPRSRYLLSVYRPYQRDLALVAELKELQPKIKDHSQDKVNQQLMLYIKKFNESLVHGSTEAITDIPLDGLCVGMGFYWSMLNFWYLGADYTELRDLILITTEDKIADRFGMGGGR